MKHLIMGTAGHIDHGKTAIIKALTDFDCDTHPEEKKRGITINLGFSHLDLDTGDSLGIIDVPGHRDFVHTMVGGAAGIDFVMMVIAADAGIMPQTREHLQILDILGVKTGFIALTKIDLVDKDILDMAKEEIGELVKGTCLEGSAIVEVSAVTKKGIDILKETIARTAGSISERPEGEVFRMFVDRVFSVSGFGSVVTGSVLSGRLEKEASAYLLPGPEKELRVRRIERHGREQEYVRSGDRASINLVGLNREDYSRGQIVSDRVLSSTDMIDVRMDIFKNSPKFDLWSQIIFHSGTYEKQAKIHLIDCNTAIGGDSVLAQVHLEAPCVLRHGDRFVIRNSSSDITLGGGEIIDAKPLHHRRRPERVINNMRKISDGTLTELVFSEVRKRYTAISCEDIADILNIPSGDILSSIKNNIPEDISVFEYQGGSVLVIKTEFEKTRRALLNTIEAFLKRNPLDSRGISFPELVGSMGIGETLSAKKLLEVLLESLINEGVVTKDTHTYSLKGYSARISPEMRQKIEAVDEYLKSCGMRTPLKGDLLAIAKKNKMQEKELNHITHYLVEQNIVYEIDNEFVHASIVDACRDKLVSYLKNNKEGVKVAEFRDLVKGNRKICLLLLSLFDKEGTTKRDGDFRVSS